MKIQKEELGNCQVQLIVEVEPAQVEEAKRKVVKEHGKQVRVPGFRPGKAPYSLVVQAVGEGTILEQAVEELLPTVLEKAVLESEVNVYSFRDIEAGIESIEPLTLRFVVPTMPDVKLGDIDTISVERNEVAIAEERVEEVLENLRESRAVWEPNTGPAQYGDRVTVDLKGDLMTGETVVDEQGVEMELVQQEATEEEGEGNETGQAPDIAGQLTGMMINQVKEFPLVYPEDWADPKMAGRTVLYRATLLDLKRRQDPELNDEFAQEIGEFGTLDELRERIRTNLASEAEDEEFNRVVYEIIDALADESELNYPDAMVKHEVERRVQQLERQIAQYGLGLDQYLQITQKSREEVEAEFQEAAEEYVRRSLTLSEYVRANEVEATDEEIERELDSIVASYDPQAGRSLRERIVNDPEALEDVRNSLISRKAIYHLYSRVTGEEAPPLFPEPVQEELAPAPVEAAGELVANESEEEVVAEAEQGTEEETQAGETPTPEAAESTEEAEQA